MSEGNQIFKTIDTFGKLRGPSIIPFLSTFIAHSSIGQLAAQFHTLIFLHLHEFFYASFRSFADEFLTGGI